MEDGAQDIRYVSQPGALSTPRKKEPKPPSLSDADLEAAAQLAEFHRMLAAELPPHSQIRGLVLRCAGHWSRLGAIPHNGLAEAERRNRG